MTGIDIVSIQVSPSPYIPLVTPTWMARVAERLQLNGSIAVWLDTASLPYEQMRSNATLSNLSTSLPLLCNWHPLRKVFS